MRWKVTPSSGSNFVATTLSGGQPAFLVSPNASIGMGSYPNANNGVQNFNPYFLGSTSLTLGVTGLTPNTTVSDVTLSFGTGPETVITTGGTVPAPPSLVIAMTGLGIMGGVGLVAACRRRQAVLA